MDGTSVKVAVRIRPLGTDDAFDEAQLCINTIPGVPQVRKSLLRFTGIRYHYIETDRQYLQCNE